MYGVRKRLGDEAFDVVVDCAVVDPAAVSTANHQPGPPQFGEML